MCVCVYVEGGERKREREMYMHVYMNIYFILAQNIVCIYGLQCNISVCTDILKYDVIEHKLADSLPQIFIISFH